MIEATSKRRQSDNLMAGGRRGRMRYICLFSRARQTSQIIDISGIVVGNGSDAVFEIARNASAVLSR